MEFKERLKSLRKERKLTQSDLAKILNYGYTAISNYESGRNEPSISDLKKISIYFEVSLDYLLCMTEIRNPYVEPKESESLGRLKVDFISLTEQHKKELLHYMHFLTQMQDEEFHYNHPSSLSIVAEPMATYGTKNSIKDTLE